MGDVEKEIQELFERTGRTRHQFLKAEVQTCLTALEMAQYELSIGNTPVAEREVDFVERGFRVIERLLPKLSPEQRGDIETTLAEIKAMYNALKAELGPPPR